MIKKSAWFVVLFIVASACLDEPDCFNLNNYFIGISFKKLADSTADTVRLASLRTVEPPLLFEGDTLSRMYPRLNQYQDETTFLLEFADTTRLLRLGYVSKAQFVSENCGERFVLSELRVLEHSFDSVRLLRTSPTSEPGAIHIEIYQ